ncbi:MAG: tetratricopeptide repeat protein, partial [Prevotella sp.]|nr:tetratricopeptide repeat protein [Prevotella sp.]
KYIVHPELLKRETLYDLRSFVAMYPCQQAARLLMLQNLYILHDPTFDGELRTAAFYVTDRTALFNLVEAPFYKLATPAHVAAEQTTGDADKLIDDFVEAAAEEEKDSDRQPTVADATVDYMAYMMAKEGAAQDKETTDSGRAATDLIENFLQNDGGKITIGQDNGEADNAHDHDSVVFENDKDEPQEDFFTESLAKIYIRQHNYNKALEIFRQLNLNNTEKSGYFADQMRFLEKVIAAGNGNIKGETK